MSAADDLKGHSRKVRQPRFYFTKRKAAFTVCSGELWNRLPSHIAEAPTESIVVDHLETKWCSMFPDFV